MSLQLYQPRPRSRLLFWLLPGRQQPQAADNPLLCPHGYKRFFNVDLGYAVPGRFGDVYAYVKCERCALENSTSNPGVDRSFKCKKLNNLTDEERTTLRNDMEQALMRIGVLSHTVLDGFLSTPRVESSVSEVTPRRIWVHVFIEADVSALSCAVAVDDVADFEFRRTELFEVSNAGGTPPTAYERYDADQDRFTDDSAMLESIDLSHSGNLVDAQGLDVPVVPETEQDTWADFDLAYDSDDTGLNEEEEG
ncbi:hypothetical protein FB451DRAFT_1412690 [Mycena latifolia]|nr:hypothetical protein FB451DRAFT_1412690 [Mycena latifolia]